ncbi:MAG: DUF3052 family protein [Bacteroidetes bacterium]|nr:DUF3052 family protein [Bacteroidota bacterium]
MAAGYSGIPLSKKLGIKEGFTVRLINAPGFYKKMIADVKVVYRTAGTVDFIHFFTNSLIELEGVLPMIKGEIKKDGMIWVSWYKKASGKPTQLTENMVRDTALAAGLVDVKVCAVDENWSGLKLVYRLKDR